MTSLLNVSEKRAQEIMLEQDKAREKLVGVHFNKDINDSLLYDMTWNTDTVSMEEMAQSIIKSVKSKITNTQKNKESQKESLSLY